MSLRTGWDAFRSEFDDKLNDLGPLAAVGPGAVLAFATAAGIKYAINPERDETIEAQNTAGLKYYKTLKDIITAQRQGFPQSVEKEAALKEASQKYEEAFGEAPNRAKFQKQIDIDLNKPSMLTPQV